MTAGEPRATAVQIRDGGGLIRDEVYTAVIQQIVSGTLSAGDRLSERLLAAEFGVSRMPVKEAMRRLENEGFVRIIPRRGIIIARSATEAVQDAVNVRAVFEALAAGLVARRLAHDDPEASAIRQELVQLLRDMRAASRQRDVDALQVVNARFHEAIRLRSGNRYITQFAAVVIAVDRAVRQQALADLDEQRRGVREHIQVATVILDGVEDSAELAMRAHVLRSGEHVLRQLCAEPGEQS
jgi:DNA-binding GntR family transcriptional regulator